MPELLERPGEALERPRRRSHADRRGPEDADRRGPGEAPKVSEADRERRSRVLGASSLAASLAMAAVFEAEKAETSGQALKMAADEVETKRAAKTRDVETKRAGFDCRTGWVDLTLSPV